ncbi:MAG: XrtA/PEP-CTERM system TPR-repeat protein PrsT [Pseudomonadota bacterium]
MSSNRKKLFGKVAIISEVILLSVVLAACSKTQTSEGLISEAKAYQQKGDTKAAIIQLKNALQKNPDDAQARFLLGSIYAETGEVQSAEKELRKAMSLGISADLTKPLLAKVLVDMGQFQKILDEIKPMPGSPLNAQIASARGNAYLALNQPQEAKAAFEEALKEKADYPDALIGLAKHAIATKDTAGAGRLAEQAVAKNPSHVDSWFFKGHLARAEGKSDAALLAYGEALKLKPGNAEALIAKANIEISTGKFDAAKADIDAARKAAPNSPIISYTQALLEFSQQKHAAALESVQQVLRVAPEHMPSILLAGAIQYALGATQQSEQHLKKYLEKNPNHLYASKLLAASLLKNGQTQGALNIVMPALKTAQQDTQLLTLAGESYMQAKDFPKANDYFEKASALAPQTANIHTALALSKLAQGENARAVAELELATTLDPKPAQAGVLLVMTHLRLKEFDKAIAAANTLEKTHPKNPVVQNLKGGAYLGKGNAAQARASFEKALAMEPTYFPALSNLAQLDMQEKKPADAKKRFEALLAVDKKNVNAMTALANLAASQGRKEEATTWLERASTENPNELRPALQLAAHYLSLGEKQKGLALAQKLQTANPDNVDALDLLAQAKLANDDKTGALESYKRLAGLSPTSPIPHFRMAAVHMTMQNAGAAAEALKTSLSIKPDFIDAQVALSMLEVRNGNLDQAMVIARQIQKQNAKLPVGFEIEGNVLMMQKKPALAVKSYEQAFAVSKTAPVMIKLHDALQQSGKEKDADARLAQWMKEQPKDTTVRMYLATKALLKKQNKIAIDQYLAVLQTEPGNAAAMNNLALALQEEKDPRALEYAEKAHKLMPENAGIMDTLGWILVEQGNTSRGLPLLQKATTLAPNSADVRYHFAAGLLKSGDKAKGRQELEQLLASGKTFPKIEEAKALLKQMQ